MTGPVRVLVTTDENAEAYSVLIPRRKLQGLNLVRAHDVFTEHAIKWGLVEDIKAGLELDDELEDDDGNIHKRIVPEHQIRKWIASGNFGASFDTLSYTPLRYKNGNYLQDEILLDYEQRIKWKMLAKDCEGYDQAPEYEVDLFFDLTIREEYCRMDSTISRKEKGAL